MSPQPAPLAVVVGTDPEAVARIAQAVESAGGRTVVFVGELSNDRDRTAVLDLITELA
ncbi:MAG: hypothetical protein WEB19_05145 [Acidimicrobiia bacterium]